MALQRLLSQLRDGPGGNDAMVDQLKHHVRLSEKVRNSPAKRVHPPSHHSFRAQVVAAFRAVDRGQFVDDEESKEAIYMDMPFRHGRLPCPSRSPLTGNKDPITPVPFDSLAGLPRGHYRSGLAHPHVPSVAVQRDQPVSS